MEFPMLEGVIIAMKGLPFTGKSEIARVIGEMARCPVLYIDDLLGTVSLEKNYTSKSMPSEEEAERLYRLAFDGLCKSAYHHLHWMKRCVVIKSRLCSTFELDRLLLHGVGRATTVVIVECHVKNEHRLCVRLEGKATHTPEYEEWYKPRSRLDFEKARDDWLISQPTWDLHLSNLINAHELRTPRVIRLALDPIDDLNLNRFRILDLTHNFRDVISSLLTRYGSREEDWIGEEIIRERYEVVQFHKLRRYLVEKELLRASTSRQKSKYLCATARGGKCCVFETRTEEELRRQVVVRGDDDDDDYKCGVCEERVVSGYTCQFCILTLHKSCAELQGFNFLGFTSNPWLIFYPKRRYRNLPRRYACKSCAEGGKDFSDDCKSCLYQTHLKCRMFPTIINHDSHHHTLSLQVGKTVDTRCKACEYNVFESTYACYLCGLYYDLVCLSRPGKVKHKHGGHEHVMKLVFSRDGMEPEEDYWCGVCYEDMDPQLWFYSCQDCPYYAAHAHCIKPVKK